MTKMYEFRVIAFSIIDEFPMSMEIQKNMLRSEVDIACIASESGYSIATFLIDNVVMRIELAVNKSAKIWDNIRAKYRDEMITEAVINIRSN